MWKNVPAGSVLKLDGTLVHSQGIAPASASEVTYDNTGTGLSSTDVQAAITEVAMPMQPTKRGTAYGLQNSSNGSDGYGRNCNPGDYSLDIYSASGPGVVQRLSSVSSLVIQNDTADTELTTLDKSIVCVNSGTIADADLTQSVVLATLIQSIGNAFAKAALIGNFLDVDLVHGESSIVISTNSDATETVTIAGNQAAYIGNCTKTLTVADRDFVLSDYDTFRFTTIPSGTTAKCLYYDATTGAITNGDLPTASVSDKTSTVSGKQHGFTAFTTNSIENVGYNNMPGYQVSNATIANRVVAVGQSLFTNATNGGSMQNCMFMGSNVTVSPTASFRNAVIFANNYSNTSTPGVVESIMITPKASGVLAMPGAVPLANSIILCPNDVTLTSTSDGSTLTLSSGRVVTGTKNMIISRSSSDVNMQQTSGGGGHILITNSDSGYTIGLANVYTKNIILNIDNVPTIVPAGNNDFICNSTGIRWLLTPLTVSNFAAGDLTNFLYNKTSNRIIPVNRSSSGYGVAPIIYNMVATCSVSGAECRAFVTIPYEYQSSAWVAKMTVLVTARNPTTNAAINYRAGVTQITNDQTIKINAYEQPNGGAQTAGTTDIIVDIILGF